jgi:branched-chain amino acid transport system ATP-binding protein
MLLKVENLVKNFEGLAAISDVSFDIQAGEILTIIGPNGAGKSVLFNLISGLLRPTAGRISFAGQDITAWRPYRVARRGLTRTFQTTALFDQLRVIDNLAIGYKRRTGSGFWGALFRSGPWQKDRQAAQAKVMETLMFTGLIEKAHHLVSTLSQGEQKRLAIGTALISEPRLLLLDEPTGGLIQEDTDAVTELIRRISQAGVTVCLIEHKMRMVMDLAHRIIVLNYGSKIAEGTPEEISGHPEVIAAYLGRKALA